jgi:SHS2 domain-containing protein
MENSAGYRELEHTADWQLEVWAPNYIALLEQAARGMYHLSGARALSGAGKVLTFRLPPADLETMLVAFLAELLYYQEQEGLVFDTFNLSLEGAALQAELHGLPLAGLDKEIKAVTYHKLQIRHTQRGLQARIVFDV